MLMLVRAAVLQMLVTASCDADEDGDTPSDVEYVHIAIRTFETRGMMHLCQASWLAGVSNPLPATNSVAQILTLSGHIGDSTKGMAPLS